MSQFRQFERLRYFTGKLLGAEDLQLEQDYFHDKSRLRNRFLHGWGIVTGLDVSLEQGTTIVVSPGFALDCAGNELVLAEPERLSLTGLAGGLYVTIRYVEIPVAPQASLLGEPESSDDLEFSRVREGVHVEVMATNPLAGHRGMGPGRSGCGQSHALCLATIRRRGRRWQVVPAKRGFHRRT